MISTVRSRLLYFVPFLASVLVAGCGGGGGGGGGGAPGPPPGPPVAAPTVSTLAVTSVVATGATLNGNVAPNGLPTECWFEYGTAPTLGTRDNTARAPVGSGTASQSVADTISGLVPGTAYYYRTCASNSAGTARGPIVAFTTCTIYACIYCHGGADGSQPGVNGAPVITKYWRNSGHGNSDRGPALQCEDCHDVGSPAGAHATDGSGTVNTLAWPGKPDNTANANTAHLRSFFFPASTAAAADYAIAFDNACNNRVGCHARAGGGYFVKIHAHAKDGVMEFGTFGTAPDPKIYAWYFQVTYADDFYKSQTAWTIADLTTDAAGTTHYGTCVSCHDPHGTGTTDQNYAGRNVMLRGNWDNGASQFCTGPCHRP